nr:DNA internalization-related competence protein ComEC/Rec2 [Desulforhopalus vacuolatus]
MKPFFFIIAILATVTCWYFIKYRPRKTSSCLPLYLLAFLLGALFVSTALRLPIRSNVFYSFPAKRDAVIIGTMLKMAKQNDRTSSATIECSEVRFADSDFQPVTGRATVSLEGPWPEDILPGNRLMVRATFKRPQSWRTPGTFDYTRYLATQGITITGFSRSSLFFTRLPAVQHSLIHRTVFAAERTRTRLARAINTSLPEKNATLFRALLLGDRSGVDDQTLENFKRAGVLHTLAISGLHLTVVSGLLYLLFYLLLSQSEHLLLFYPVHILSFCATLPFLLFYAFLTGLNPPVLRAVIMAIVVTCAVITRRVGSSSTLLATAALALLILNPLQLYTASFQLSFLAVAAIFLFIPLMEKVGQKRVTLTATWAGRIAAAFFLSCGITLFTAPVTIVQFNRLSAIGPLANLLIEPLLCLITLPLGLLALPFLYAGNPIGPLLLKLASLPMELSTCLVKWFASLPCASFAIAAEEPWFAVGTLLFYIALGLLALGAFYNRWNPAQRRLSVRCAAFLPGLLPLATAPFLFFHPPAHHNRAVFLDVGQGSATFLEWSDGKRILVDGGGGVFTRDLGKRAIAPFFWSKGVSRIDAVVATHSDADHTRGLPFIVQTFHPQALYLRALQEKNKLVARMEKSAVNAGSKVFSPATGETLSGNHLLCLYNFGLPDRRKRKTKNRGLVLLARFQNKEILLPGDIDKEAEQMLIDMGKIHQTSLLLAAHHGSKTSNSAELLNRLNPQIVFVSNGDRPGIFPSTSLIKELKQRNIPLLDTRHYGTIEIEFLQKGWRLFHWQRPNHNPLLPLKKIEILL